MRAFKSLGKTTLFADGNYLANPRDTNGTPSLIVGLGRSGVKGPDGKPLSYEEIVSSEQFKKNAYAASDTPNYRRMQNSVPDQYLVRAGVGYSAWENVGITAALRIEGLQRYDLIGESNGFRRPGRQISIEPGVSYSDGRGTWTLNVPIAVRQNRFPDPYTRSRGDATFPDYIVLMGYSRR
ncbi:hypothetical protein FJZ36_15095 [Candidatus Poribacteria bacterium]|nr:hypothetical protein [Candidatus Poribacteria bacterium]